MNNSDDIEKGDRVILLKLPDWLLNDLPEQEKIEMRSFVGRDALVSEVDKHGYFWLGFGSTTTLDNTAFYSGHTFCVPRDCIKLF